MRYTGASDDLSGHFLLVEPRVRQQDSNFIGLFDDGRPVRVLPMASMDGNAALLRAAALTGTGIAAPPEAMIREDVANGRLIYVLPGCPTSDNEVEICLFYSHRELLPARFEYLEVGDVHALHLFETIKSLTKPAPSTSAPC